MNFYDQFNKKMILVTTPPRSSGMFLYFLLQDYLPDDHDLDVFFTKHNPSFLTIENPHITNLVTLRNPVDMISSMIFYSLSKNEDSIAHRNSVINGMDLLLDKFYSNFFKSNNNILFSFDSLTKNPMGVLKYICEETKTNYIDEYDFSIDKLNKYNKNYNNIHTNNLPRKLPNITLEIKDYVSSYAPVNKIIFKQQHFLNLCTKRGAKGIYG